MSLKTVIGSIIQFFKDVRTVNRDKATRIIEFEVMELENIFSLTLFGSFTGMPSPPVHITLQLLPSMQEQLVLMFNRVATARDALGELGDILGEP